MVAGQDVFLQRGEFNFILDHPEVVALKVVLGEVRIFRHGKPVSRGAKSPHVYFSQTMQ
jgi:hypothetical protein